MFFSFMDFQFVNRVNSQNQPSVYMAKNIKNSYYDLTDTNTKLK